MAICPNCGKRINKGTGNKRKVNGVMVHKECPGKKSNRVVRMKAARRKKK